MARGFSVKRLMMQASISVFAALLLSSATMAEDNTEAAGDNASVSIDVETPDVSIDPVEIETAGEGDQGDVGSDGREDAVTTETDVECADCSGNPDIFVDQAEMSGPVPDDVDVSLQNNLPRGSQATQRGNDEPGGQTGVTFSNAQGLGGDRDNDFGWKRRKLLK